LKNKVMQAVVFPADMELARLRKEHAIMLKALKAIKGKDYFPDKSVTLYELQSCINLADEAIEEMEGDY
jgi:hypothetical protein